MRREERRDLPMEWMRMRDPSSSFYFPNFGRFHGKRRDGGSLSLSFSLFSLANTRKKEGGAGKKRKEGERKE